jgi:hypothetical protein
MFNSDSSNERKAPIMERTKIQLATSYSPGTLFTFESNLVICESISKNNYDRASNIKSYTRDQIFKNIAERAKAWYTMAMRANTAFKPEMCVDKNFLNQDCSSLRDKLDERLFGFAEPNKMGYEPSLLTMVCSRCQRVKFFENLKDFHNKRRSLSQHACDTKNSPQFCDWRQMDIVFVHPNGNKLSPLPWIYQWDTRKSEYYKFGERCFKCYSLDVKINNRSTQIGKRFFYCADCNMPRNTIWLQNDKEYIKELGTSPVFTIADIRMKPVSCRANSAHYPQQDMVIDFGDSQILDVLNDTSALENYLAHYFSLPRKSLSYKEMEQIIIQKKGIAEWNAYSSQKITLKEQKDAGGEKMFIDLLERSIRDKERAWNEENIFPNVTSLPKTLLNHLRSRQEIYASKFDPFRLLVEHDALREKVVSNQTLKTGLRRFTPLDDLDSDVGPENRDELIALNKRHSEILDAIGVETLGLVREFITFNYSYGYTRVAPTPTVNYINNRTVPVRLNLFPKTSIDNQKQHPIFVLKQDNEAIYVKLNENSVRTWLEWIDPLEKINEAPIGLQYLMHAPPMNAFLDNLPSSNLIKKPQFSLALYTLLHTYSHHVMTSISEYSGLGIGSLGEYLFPANLAFIIYRRGMTMDLGNLSSLLRNNAPAFLEHLANRRNLGCGSGYLCLSRGGACPDCLLIPEVSCIAQNDLLSRSVLIGKDNPRNYGFNRKISGYFDVAQGIL